MRVLSWFFLLLLCVPAFAQEQLSLSHSIVGMEQSSTGTLLHYRLNLRNLGSQNFHTLQLALHDVSLSVTGPTDGLDFHTLSAGQQKHRFLTLHSALASNQLTQTDDLLFRLQAIDEQGQVYSILLRSKAVSP